MAGVGRRCGPALGGRRSDGINTSHRARGTGWKSARECSMLLCTICARAVGTADDGQGRISRPWCHPSSDSARSGMHMHHLASSYLAFVVAAALLAVTPGPGIAYVVARTAAGGRSEGLASCLGTAVGGMLHVLAAALGLTLLLVRSTLAFSVVKLLGAGYLVVLGLRLVLRAQDEERPIGVSALGSRKALRDGVVVEALNVKTAMFFVAFLPQFVEPTGSVALQLAAMGTVCVLLNTLADVLAVVAAYRVLRSTVLRAKRARLLARASGVTMIGLGICLSVFRRTS
jgi:threonine/homoserine/homoserine lactone efflux protein